MLERPFQLREKGTNVRTELIAGATTFMTLSYIVFVQPAVLSACGMDFGAVFVATCLSSAFATVLMAFLANYPIALAPAMGHNFFFAFTVCLGMGYDWRLALGAVFVSGTLFVFLSIFGLREMIVTAMPRSLKNAIAVGIGLLIALFGFEWGGVAVDDPHILLRLGDVRSPALLLTLFGVVLIAALMALRVRGAILLGIIASTIIGLALGLVEFKGLWGMPPSVAPTFLKLDFVKLFSAKDFLVVVFIFFVLDLFDTVGTLVGVSERAGFIEEDGHLPRAKGALLSDALGTVSGALLGTSTVTSYIESAAGVSEGGRSGLANITTAALMLLALFFYPFAQTVGRGYSDASGVFLYPLMAPALIIVGCLMLKSVVGIDWDDPTEAIPSFLTLIIMPFTFSITEGISFGLISYCFLKLISGKGRQVHWIIYLSAGLLILRYIVT